VGSEGRSALCAGLTRSLTLAGRRVLLANQASRELFRIPGEGAVLVTVSVLGFVRWQRVRRERKAIKVKNLKMGKK
jgi:hypothetical protein